MARTKIEDGGYSKLTPERVETLVSAVRRGMSRQDAATYAGITYGTLREWIRLAGASDVPLYSELRHRLHAAEMEYKQAMLDTLQSIALPHDEVTVKITEDGEEQTIKRGVVHFGALKMALERSDRITAPQAEPASDGDPTDLAALLRGQRDRNRALLASAESSQARAALNRQLGIVERALFEATYQRPASAADLPEEAYLAELEAAGADMPEAHGQAMLRGYLRRHGRELAEVVAAAPEVERAQEDDGEP